MLFGLCLLVQAAPVGAQATPPGGGSQITFKSLGYSDQTVIGMFPTANFFVPGPQGGDAGPRASFRLIMAHSELLLPDRSTITVKFNDLPVYNAFLNLENAKRHEVIIPLPADHVRKDFNQISAMFEMHIARQDCETATPANNSTIFADSGVTYDTTASGTTSPAPELDKLPVPFVNPDLALTQDVPMVVNERATGSELSAAASITGKLAQITSPDKFRAFAVAAGSPTEIDLRGKGNMVLIGRPDRNRTINEIGGSLPLKVQGNGFLDPGGQPIPPDAGVIQVASSPWARGSMVLVVSGGSDEGLRKAAVTLSSTAGLKSLHGPFSIVREELNVGEISQPSPPGDSIQVLPLGTEDWSSTGSGEHVLSVTFEALPLGDKGEAVVDLYFAHSPLLSPTRSSFQARLNGVPVTSIALTEKNQQRTLAHFTLPSTSLKPGRNALVLAFTLHRIREECDPAEEQLWAVVYSDSRLTVPPGTAPLLYNLAWLPYPFIDHGSMKGSAIVFPADVNQIGIGLQVSAQFGKYFKSDAVNIPSVPDTEATPDFVKDRHLVVYGLPGNNKLIQGDVAKHLPLQFGPDGRILRAQSSSFLNVKDAATLGVLEEILAPWNERKAVLLVSGTDPRAQVWALVALTNPDLTGNVATMASDRQLSTFIISSGQPVVKQAQEQRFRAVPILTALVLLAALGMLAGALVKENIAQRSQSNGR